MLVRTIIALALVLAVDASCANQASARPPTQWSKVKTPAQGKAQSFGGYSAGCVSGAQPLAVTAPYYQVMRPERHRHFGHPALIQFVQTLAKKAHDKSLKKLAVGDLGQPRGGPAPSGHASHQSGLDVDLWFTPASPKREQHSVIVLPTNERSNNWSERVPELLELAGSSPEVARIFVNPIIKRQLCESVKGKRKWLRKLRPWYGHHEHFHVRLSCPHNSPQCKDQSPVPAGDGCDKLDWWLDAQHEKDRKKGGAKYGKRVGAKPSLPSDCQTVIRSQKGG